MGSPFLMLHLYPSLGPPETEVPMLAIWRMPYPARIRWDVKARFLNFKPATRPSGHFSHRNECRARAKMRHLTHRVPAFCGGEVGRRAQLIDRSAAPICSGIDRRGDQALAGRRAMCYRDM